MLLRIVHLIRQQDVPLRGIDLEIPQFNIKAYRHEAWFLNDHDATLDLFRQPHEEAVDTAQRY